MPNTVNPILPSLIALHGISRDADAIYAAFAARANDQKRVLIVPRFSLKHWPVFQRIGRARPDKAILELIMMLRSSGIIQTEACEMFGFSGGAQLAHRFAMLYPYLVSRLHLASPGWYTLPDASLPFPAGLGQPAAPQRSRENKILAAMQAQLPNYLKLPLRVYVGDGDTEQDPALRNTPLLNAVQGPHRLARAKTYIEHFNKAARTFGIVPDTRLTILNNCSHDFSQCAAQGNLVRHVLC